MKDASLWNSIGILSVKIILATSIAQVDGSFFLFISFYTSLNGKNAPIRLFFTQSESTTTTIKSLNLKQVGVV
jgi:hypothetical protein